MGQSYSAEPVVEKHTETDRNDTFDVAVSSCQGWRLSQEDDHNLKLELPGPHKASFFAVFDGHGSDKVSKYAAESLWRHIIENKNYIEGRFDKALEEAFLSFDQDVSEVHTALLAGSTATCVLIVDNVVYCANIGDSRSLASVNCECVPLSYDHKPENPSELMRILAGGGYVIGNRVNGNLALSRAFGDFHYKSNDQMRVENQIVSAFPDIECLELTDDLDFIVLACDGIWDVLTSIDVNEFIIERLENEVRPDQICEQMTTRCLATDHGQMFGCDNMTVLLVCYTRGRSWSEYCTDIFNKNSKRLNEPDRKRKPKNFTDDLSRWTNERRSTDTVQDPDYQFSSTSANPFREDLNEQDVVETKNTEPSFHVPPSSDERPEQVETIHDDIGSASRNEASESSGDKNSSQTDTIEREQSLENADLSNNQASQEEPSKSGEVTEQESTQNNEIPDISGIAQINLEDNLANIASEDVPDESEIEPIDLNVQNANETETPDCNTGESAESQGVVEIELCSPVDDDKEGGQINDDDKDAIDDASDPAEVVNESS